MGWGDTFGTPREGLQGVAPPRNLASLPEELCFNSSEVVIANSSLEFDEDGERMGGTHPTFGGLHSDPPG